MAKILISPLGVGGRFKANSDSEREYRTVNYKIDEQKLWEWLFNCSVIKISS